MPDNVTTSQPSAAVNTQLTKPAEIQGVGNASSNYSSNSYNGSGVHFDNATNYAQMASDNFQASSTSGIVGKSALAGIGSGAAIGGTIGSIIPGVGTAIGGAVGSVIGGLIGLFTGRKRKKENEKAQREAQQKADANQTLAYERTMELQRQQQDAQQAYYDKNFSYKAQVQQMKDAGLNPASMYSQGTQGSGGSVGSAPSVSSADTIQPYYKDVGSPSQSAGMFTNAVNGGVSDMLGAANLELSALSTGANNTRTLADAAGISIDNQSRNLRNVSEILKTFAEIDKLKASGKLDETQANKITSLLQHEIDNIQENTRLTSITADNTEAVMESTAANNNASASEHYASTGLKKQQTATEKHNTENARFNSYRNDLAWTSEKNQHLISLDLAAKCGLDSKYSAAIAKALNSAANQAGISLVDVPTKTIFSWFDFGNWKNIFTTKMFTSSNESMFHEKLAEDMRQFSEEMNYKNSNSPLVVADSWQEYYNKNASRQFMDTKTRIVEEGSAVWNKLSQNDKKLVNDRYAKLVENGDRDAEYKSALYAKQLYQSYSSKK